MTERTSDWLDSATLQMLTDLGERRGKDLLAQLYGLFQTQGPSGIAELRRALSEGDAVAFTEAAHSLKGSYRSLGTPRLAEIAADLEAAGRAGRLDGVASEVDDLESAFHHTDQALGDFIASRGTT
ncbi:MAG: Hpt domain-containing protein [Acidobacteriota bacterium]